MLLCMYKYICACVCINLFLLKVYFCVERNRLHVYSSFFLRLIFPFPTWFNLALEREREREREEIRVCLKRYSNKNSKKKHKSNVAKKSKK